MSNQLFIIRFSLRAGFTVHNMYVGVWVLLCEHPDPKWL